jgi:hypothetical protein
LHPQAKSNDGAAGCQWSTEKIATEFNERLRATMHAENPTPKTVRSLPLNVAVLVKMSRSPVACSAARTEFYTPSATLQSPA